METMLLSETKQLKQKPQEHYNDLIFVNLEDVVCFRNVVEYIIIKILWSFKNNIEDKTEWVKKLYVKFYKISNPIQPIEDVSSIIDSNLSIVFTPIQIFLKHLIISGIAIGYAVAWTSPPRSVIGI